MEVFILGDSWGEALAEFFKLIQQALTRAWRPPEERRKEDRYLTEQEAEALRKELKDKQANRFKLKDDPILRKGN